MAEQAHGRMALVASDAEAAQAAEAMLRARYGFVPIEEADLIVALGGDGFLLHTLRERLTLGEVCPVFGMNRGTVGFLMNEWRIEGLIERIAPGKAFTVSPLATKAGSGERGAGRGPDRPHRPGQGVPRPPPGEEGGHRRRRDGEPPCDQRSVAAPRDP